MFAKDSLKIMRMVWMEEVREKISRSGQPIPKIASKSKISTVKYWNICAEGVRFKVPSI